MAIQPIETRYAGHRFRSRLEARWAVFFDKLGIHWQYEPQGFNVPRSTGGTTPYLPDFLLPGCGTWIEVKGVDADLDRGLMTDAALALPASRLHDPGPRLMILGPLPDPRPGDWGWLGLTPFWDESNQVHEIGDAWWGFGGYAKSGRPWMLTETSTATAYAVGDDGWLEPAHDPSVPYPTDHAYQAARSARFEHGEAG